MLQFRIPEKKYLIKVIDSLSYLSGKLDDLGKDLENDKKIQLKYHFKSKFKSINNKLPNFPYNYVKRDNFHEENIPDKSEFYNIITMKKLQIKNIMMLNNFINL